MVVDRVSNKKVLSFHQCMLVAKKHKSVRSDIKYQIRKSEYPILRYQIDFFFFV